MDYEAEVVSVDSGTPVETVVEPQPVVEETVEANEEETVETTKEPVKAEENLVELPDGRKLPPKEAEVEYRNLYSEFTRKSQKLATYEKGNESNHINNQNTDVGKQEWIPETWDEVLERSKQALREDMEKEKTQEQQFRTETETRIRSELDELKKSDPTLNENQLFNHALKYKNPDGTPVFTSLTAAYQNMKDMYTSVRKASETTAQNILKRNADPISGGTQGGDVFDGDVYDPTARNTSLVDVLRSMNK